MMPDGVTSLVVVLLLFALPYGGALACAVVAERVAQPLAGPAALLGLVGGVYGFSAAVAAIGG
jgi:hypothetical protein